MLRLRPEEEQDWWEVEALYDLTFAPGREALSSYRLRDDVPALARLCCVAHDVDGCLCGAIRVWPVRVGRHVALLVGPVAVHPTRQGEGIGAALIREVIVGARDLGHDRLLLIGDEPYYGRFGFARLEGVTMPAPTNPDRVLGLGLKPAAWEGVLGDVTRHRSDATGARNSSAGAC
ncbi:MAG: N-acetyltransferase [Pseudomonadota bacterium]